MASTRQIIINLLGVFQLFQELNIKKNYSKKSAYLESLKNVNAFDLKKMYNLHE